MKFSLSFALLGALVISACTDYEQPPPPRTTRYPADTRGAQYPPTQQPFNPNAGPPPEGAAPDTGAQPPPTSAAAPTKAAKGDYPYGSPVPDKPGFVKSPFAPDQGLVDVRGFPPGTEVKDPFTNKIFLVP